MEKSIEEIKEMHNLQLKKLDDEINSLKETIKRWQFENELLSEQFKTTTFELINQERLVIKLTKLCCKLNKLIAYILLIE